jgi:DNA polymerase III alpha subunit (gram-positive type)
MVAFMNSLSSLFENHKALVLFDCETNGLDPDKHQIIELAAMRIEQTPHEALRIADQMDTFIKLPDGEQLPANIVELTGITDAKLLSEGVGTHKAAKTFARMFSGTGTVLMVARNAQFDIQFVSSLLRKEQQAISVAVNKLDTLTVFKDRRPYPHKLANAIIAYNLTDKVQNSHRAIDDVLAMFEVMKAMAEERDDLTTYINLFGYNPKYGVSGRRIPGIRYEVQGFNNIMTRPEQTLPAKLASKGAARR